MPYSERTEKREEVNGRYIARAIIWVVLAAIIGGTISFSRDTTAKDSAQDTQIAVMQAQYQEINAKLIDIKNDVASMRSRQERYGGVQLEGNTKNSSTRTR